jgi:hypothetical protein
MKGSIMIRLEPKQGEQQGFVVRSDEPIRVEVVVGEDGELHAFVYTGMFDDLEQDPVGAFDGTIANTPWTV